MASTGDDAAEAAIRSRCFAVSTAVAGLFQQLAAPVAAMSVRGAASVRGLDRVEPVRGSIGLHELGAFHPDASPRIVLALQALGVDQSGLRKVLPFVAEEER